MKTKKKLNSKKTKSRYTHTHTHTHTHTKKNKKVSSHVVNKIVNKIDFDILFTTLTIQILFLIYIKTPKDKIKIQIILLLKEIRKNNKIIKSHITDDELTIIFNRIYNFAIVLHKHLKNKNKSSKKQTQPHTQPQIQTQIHLKDSKTKGGFYLKDLEDKGDQPITGADLTKFLDEVDQFYYNAQYTDEGMFLQKPYTLLQMFRGQVDAFKSFITWHVFPKYYQLYPPFLKWDGVKQADGSEVGGIHDLITRKWEDLPDYLLAYQSYQRSQDEYLVNKGLKSPSVLNKGLYKGFYDKLARKMDTTIQQFQQIRRKYQGVKSGNYTLQLPL